MTARRSVTDQAAAAAIEQGCRMLRLPTIRDRFAEIAAAAEREHLSYLGFLSELVIAECDDRTHRRAQRRVRDAGFPRPKRLDEFAFDANPAINPAVIGQLATCAWVKAGNPLCLIGDSRTGKTHLLMAEANKELAKEILIAVDPTAPLETQFKQAIDTWINHQKIQRLWRDEGLCVPQPATQMPWHLHRGQHCGHRCAHPVVGSRLPARRHD